MDKDDSSPPPPPPSGPPPTSVADTVRGMFETSNRSLPSNPYNVKKNSKNPKAKQEIEYALTMVLVEIASSSGTFDNLEVKVIADSLKKMFDTEITEVHTLINHARHSLENMRGATKYGEFLKENLPTHLHKSILQCIDFVAFRNGAEPKGFEIFLREKYRKLFSS